VLNAFLNKLSFYRADWACS